MINTNILCSTVRLIPTKVGGTRPETLVGHKNTVVLSETIRGRMDIFLMNPRLCSSYLSARSIKMHVKHYVMKVNILYGVECGDSPSGKAPTLSHVTARRHRRASLQNLAINRRKCFDVSSCLIMISTRS